MSTRMNMYNPMYYLSDYYSGYGKSNVANHWRIRTGIQQGDTALNTETNLSLALKERVGSKTLTSKQFGIKVIQWQKHQVIVIVTSSNG